MEQQLALVLIIPANKDYIVMLSQAGQRFNVPRQRFNYLRTNDIVKVIAVNNQLSLKLLTDDDNDVILYKTFSKQLVPWGYYD